MVRLTSLSRSVAGSVVIVTGAASGMGRATAHLFADEGARVALLDVNDPEAVVGEIVAAGGEAAGWVLDVADPAAVEQVVAGVVQRFGGIDILVNNAGLVAPAGIGDDGWQAAWDRTLAVNVTGQALMVRAALPHLRRAAAPRIVNIASTEGLGATAGAGAYTASKHAVVGLTRSLAVELGREAITVNCICPGPIRTAMTAGIGEDDKAKFARRRVPLRRYAEPEEVAQMTLSLSLPAASYCTGVVLQVDGGLRVQNT
ncbi:SDR family NAD(P)-dependent oxidoreductase [Pseudonocardia sp. GCM10023141]|uniref:SDR family NAD(P)-dependent oxidoreductase n=1 Tax=Pseudonocardia sp. GCM10023141 TaxID=3252653 RepID=UPI00360E831F